MPELMTQDKAKTPVVASVHVHVHAKGWYARLWPIILNARHGMKWSFRDECEATDVHVIRWWYLVFTSCNVQDAWSLAASKS